MKVSGQSKLLFFQSYLAKSRFFLTGFLTIVSILIGSHQTSLAQKIKADTNSAPSVSTASLELVNNRLLNNGVYLYGKSAKPEQNQQEYFIFEVKNNRVVGAFYMPQSSYDCFYGALEAGQLNLNIISTYDEVTYIHLVNLQDYQPIASVSSNDQRILSDCKAARLEVSNSLDAESHESVRSNKTLETNHH